MMMRRLEHKSFAEKINRTWDCHKCGMLIKLSISDTEFLKKLHALMLLILHAWRIKQNWNDIFVKENSSSSIDNISQIMQFSLNAAH